MTIGSVGGSLDPFPGHARLRKGGVARRRYGEGIIALLLSLKEGLIPGNKLAGICWGAYAKATGAARAYALVVCCRSVLSDASATSFRRKAAATAIAKKKGALVEKKSAIAMP